MKISQSDWIRYRDMMSKISKQAAEEFEHHFRGKISTTERKEIIDYAMALVAKYSEASSELACQMYERIAELSGVTIPPAEPAEAAEYGEVAKGINGTLKQSPEGKLCGDVVDRLVKRAGADTMLKNAERDRAQFAWVPHGDTCSFCIILASRGWQNISRNALKNGHAEHIHAHCDCQYCVRFNQNTEVEGYDPDKYLEMYENAEGNKWRDKLNAMRREEDSTSHKWTDQDDIDIIHNEIRIEMGKEKHSLKKTTGGLPDLPDRISERPEMLGDYTPEELKQALEASGYEVKPLSKGSLKGIQFEDGGGFKTNFQDGGLLQYHPGKNRRHGGEYYKISTGKGGTKRYDTKGNLKEDET